MAGPVHWSRRSFLCRLGVAGVGAAAAGAGLGACTTADLAAVPRTRAVRDRSRAERAVVFANWPGYIDQARGNPGRYPTLGEFTRRTGIAVDYRVPITSDEEFLGQIGVPLAMGRSCGYDLVVLSDWMAAQLIQLGWAQPLSPALTPNASRLLPEFRNWPVPDVRRHALAWQGGFTGIVYNEKLTGRPILSMRELLTAPDLRGRVSLVTSMRDVMGLLMLDLGIDASAFTEAQFNAALAFLGRAVRSGQVGLVSNYYPAALIKGTIAAAVGWAGDVLFADETDPHIRFTWPSAGGLVWADQMVIPAYAPHPENAQKLMNFYYQPAIAAQLTVYQRYLCPVVGTEAIVRRADPRVAASPYVFPTTEILRNGHHFKMLSPQQGARYVSAYESAVGL